MTSFVSLIFILTGCHTSQESSSLSNSYEGKTVYNRVGLHGEIRGDSFISYSTNYIGTSDFYKINTEFHVVSINTKEIVLTSANHEAVHIELVLKYNHESLTQYFDEIFSNTKITLPSTLTNNELKLIDNGEYSLGMTRQALFYSVGYPPANLNSNRETSDLIYQTKRFSRVRFEFDDKNKIKHISEPK